MIVSTLIVILALAVGVATGYAKGRHDGRDTDVSARPLGPLACLTCRQPIEVRPRLYYRLVNRKIVTNPQGLKSGIMSKWTQEEPWCEGCHSWTIARRFPLDDHAIRDAEVARLEAENARLDSLIRGRA